MDEATSPAARGGAAWTWASCTRMLLNQISMLVNASERSSRALLRRD